MIALDVRSVSFKTRNTTLLDGIDLRFDRGEAVAIVGPNGAGKSTLMKVLSGDLRPSTGRVLLQNLELSSYAPRNLAARRAILSQHINVSFPFTVEEIVLMGAANHRRAAADKLIGPLLEEVELSGLRGRDFPTLSGGEQQRTHFARTLLQLTLGEELYGPGILLLDEPTSSLDLRHQIQLVDAAKKRAMRGTTVIAVLHDINLTVRFSDRIVVMNRGKIASDGDAEASISRQTMSDVFSVTAHVHRTSTAQPFILQQEMNVL
ncbi:MAG: heme ABC transporter ATP-binding protein [Xanthobacteraceae bacterium]|nr:heme ABC transporter ATP-binding protein [Xanthobacteraceae bacterium]